MHCVTSICLFISDLLACLVTSNPIDLSLAHTGRHVGKPVCTMRKPVLNEKVSWALKMVNSSLCIHLEIFGWYLISFSRTNLQLISVLNFCLPFHNWAFPVKKPSVLCSTISFFFINDEQLTERLTTVPQTGPVTIIIVCTRSQSKYYTQKSYFNYICWLKNPKPNGWRKIYIIIAINLSRRFSLHENYICMDCFCYQNANHPDTKTRRYKNMSAEPDDTRARAARTFSTHLPSILIDTGVISQMLARR